MSGWRVGRVCLPSILPAAAMRPLALLAACLFAACAAEAQGPVLQGGEVRVNTFTTGQQFDPSVGMDASGNVVIAWTSDGQDGSSFGVYAQQWAASGVPVGVEFRVNTTTIDRQESPSVAMDADGDFVVAWTANLQDGSGFGVYARRYTASGLPVGGEFRVNTTTAGDQFAPEVALGPGGDMVVVWMSNGQVGSDYGVYGQRYTASGAPVGGEFQVNTFTLTDSEYPSVAMASDGAFVVSWASGDEFGTGSSGFLNDVYARRYEASGDPAGAEFRVNTTTTNRQAESRVAMTDAGAFVVAWTSSGQDGAFNSIYAQRYTASGSSVGGEFRVNTFTGIEYIPSVGIDADGDFMVAWTSSGRDGSSAGVFAQRYAASGVPVGEEFRVNRTTTGAQLAPSVAVDADGDFIVAWQSFGQDESGSGIYAQRYAGGPVAIESEETTGFTSSITPNPLESGGTVRVTLTEAGPVRVAVYDVLGRQVAVLADGAWSAGEHTVSLGVERLVPGVYVVRVTAGAVSVVRRVTVAR